MLTAHERTRYARHLLLPEVGIDGQKRLKEASVLIVGAGGLGSPLALYLAAAGVGRIGLVDFDAVDATNLQRQILHGTADVGRQKVDSARDRLRDVNPLVRVDAIGEPLTRANALDLIGDYDLVADGADNFPTRYLVNDAAVLTGRVNVQASIYRFDGQVSVFGAPGGPCYRCLYPEPPPPDLVPTCAEGGVLGVLPGVVGSLQATEVLKCLLGVGDVLAGRLLLFDALAAEFRTMTIPRNPDCPVCGDDPTVTSLPDYEAFCGVSTPPAFGDDMTVLELHDRLQNGDDVNLIDVRQPRERDIASLGGTAIPLEALPSRLDELESLRGRDMVVYCRSGERSAHAVAVLRASGFENARNLAGGILAWSEQIDPSTPIY